MCRCQIMQRRAGEGLRLQVAASLGRQVEPMRDPLPRAPCLPWVASGAACGIVGA